jgi:hypothetical protein
MRLALAVLVLFPVPLAAQGSILDQKPIQELRGAWIRASDGVFASREQISKSMEALADAHFNVVLPCVFDGAYTLWHSPTAKEVSGADCDPAYGDRDVLSEIVFEAHRFKLEVVPWFDAGFTAKGALLEKHPTWAALGKDQKPLVVDGEHWLDALDPDVQQFVLSLVLELARNFDVDGIAGSERFAGFPAAAAGKPAQLESFRKANDGKPPSDALDPKWCAWRAQQISEFLARVSGALRPSLAIVLAPRAAGPGPGELLEDVAGWSAKKCFHELALCATPKSAAEEERRIAALLGLDWPAKNAGEICAGVAVENGAWKADGALLKALAKTHREKKITSEIFQGCGALLANDAALAKALFDEPYLYPAIPPWRSEEGWRPKPLEAKPQAGSGRWTFPDSSGPMTMILEGGKPGEASWTAHTKVAGMYQVYTWIAPDLKLGDSARYLLATKKGLIASTLKVGLPTQRGWRYLGDVQLPADDDFEVARYEAVEKDPAKLSAVGPVLLLYDRLESR